MTLAYDYSYAAVGTPFLHHEEICNFTLNGAAFISHSVKLFIRKEAWGAW